jgi:release factor glutamine methyltransferase
MTRVPPAPGTPPTAPTLQAAVQALAAAFRAAGLETPALDARRLVLDRLALDDAALLREPDRVLTEEELACIREAEARRLAREPVSRILGRRTFYGLDLEIGRATLDPRPDTETLVDGVLRLVAQGRTPGGRAPRILDVGTGSGAILIALLSRLPEATGLGVDVSGPALDIAARNAARHGLAGRIGFRQASWLDGIDGPFDIVVSNPPYIPTADLAALEPEVTRFDPMSALDGGADGLAPYRHLAAGVARVARPSAWLAVEHGAGQSAAVADILRRGIEPSGEVRTLGIEIWHDLGGLARCVALETRR